MSTRDLPRGGKVGQCVGLTTLPPSRADCLKILGASISSSPRGLLRPVQGQKYLKNESYILFKHSSPYEIQGHVLMHAGSCQTAHYHLFGIVDDMEFTRSKRGITNSMYMSEWEAIGRLMFMALKTKRNQGTEDVEAYYHPESYSRLFRRCRAAAIKRGTLLSQRIETEVIWQDYQQLSPSFTGAKNP
jgi:hypothetical protein